MNQLKGICILNAAMPLLVLLIIDGASSRRCHADEVVLQGSTANSRITLTGEVLEYTGKRLVIRSAQSKSEQTFPAADVISVRATLNDAHQSGIIALEKGDVQAAELALDRALNQELRTWVRRDLIALQIRCSFRREDWTSAGQRFLRLHQSDPDTKSMEMIPLFWWAQPLNAEARSQAIAWLKEVSPVAQLMGASWLCLEPKYEAECEMLWPKLVRNPDERLRTLAQWQSYRRRQQIEGIEDHELLRWETRISRLPIELRTGPYYLLGNAFFAKHEYDLSAAAYLRIPFSHASEHPVTPSALLAAGQCFENMRLQAEADSMYRELIQQYAYASAAQVAKTKSTKRLNSN